MEQLDWLDGWFMIKMVSKSEKIWRFGIDGIDGTVSMVRRVVYD